jgi:hypothetical protein
MRSLVEVGKNSKLKKAMETENNGTRLFDFDKKGSPEVEADSHIPRLGSGQPFAGGRWWQAVLFLPSLAPTVRDRLCCFAVFCTEVQDRLCCFAVFCTKVQDRLCCSAVFCTEVQDRLFGVWTGLFCLDFKSGLKSKWIAEDDVFLATR